MTAEKSRGGLSDDFVSVILLSSKNIILPLIIFRALRTKRESINDVSVATQKEAAGHFMKSLKYSHRHPLQID